MANEWKDPFEEALENAEDALDPPEYRHSEVQRIRQNWFLAGYIFGVASLGLIWWVAKAH